MRYSEVFSVCGLPDVKVVRAKDKKYRIRNTRLSYWVWTFSIPAIKVL
jgi:hypothetical protein